MAEKKRRWWYGLLGMGALLFLTGPSGSSCLTAYSYVECKPGTTQVCYAGPDNTEGIGSCKQGLRKCSEDGTWTGCEGMIVPAKETCNGRDDDCNGKVDDLMEVSLCTLQKGVCSGARKTCDGTTGMQTCSSTDYTKQNAAYVAEETTAHCDGLDNDCDGDVDELCECKEGQTRSCFSGQSGCVKAGESYNCKGICKAGTQICQQGKWSACQGEELPASQEICNGRDDNCDGQIDEGCACNPGATQPCGVSDIGRCEKGTQTCDANGKWGACTGERQPQKEACNGQDDDCNGKTDDRADGSPLQEICYTGGPNTSGQGLCRSGMKECRNGKYDECKGEVTPQKEICDSKDNDCNGKVDDGTSLCSSSQICGNGQCRNAPEQVIRKGTFQSTSSRYSVAGDVEVRKGAQGERVVFQSNFSTDSGPGLYIYLVNDTQGKVVENPPNFLDLGTIKNVKGMQTYNVPTGQSVANYKSVVVWCKPFAVNFGFAALK